MVESFSLQAIESALTGESLPLIKELICIMTSIIKY
ncbi:hypothetical protein ONA00_04985 [Mycoplasmopsis cynos]|nr:hypothetical protein [Mycoplasmopsis cynos]WAM10677.1 hypothetical protein ONA00_04985 [Mycoplasmopsis cynos]